MDRRRILIGVNSASSNIDYSQIPMFFEALEDGLQVSFSYYGIQYSVDECTTWRALDPDVASPIVNYGNRIYFKGSLSTDSGDGIGIFTCNKACSLNGNIMSLLFADNFYEQYSLAEKGYAFYKLFNNNSCIIYADKLILPATTLAEGCYGYMFSGCTSLITAPELSATTLQQYCYQYMFSGCSSLTTAPVLPATTLAYGCYMYMFSGCSSLTTAPVLPATTLTCANHSSAVQCYEGMFSGCNKLNYIKAMFTTTPDASYTYFWVRNVSSTGTFVKNKNATWNVTGDHGIPSGWTVETA